MKKVFTNREVPHVWAQQTQEEGKGSNIFFEGATIYSYGRHFPIATIEGDDVLFTLRSYSNTTAKHKSSTLSAVSHKNIIYCKDVPVKYFGDKKPLNKQSFTKEHAANLEYWKVAISEIFSELGNKKNRNIDGRINEINSKIDELNKYVAYFGIKIKDKELNNLLKIAKSPDFITHAREAKEKQDAANAILLNKAYKAYELYIGLWRNYKEDEIKELPEKTKDLIRTYERNTQGFTRLRLNSKQARIETSKGIQIPVQIAKNAYMQLNGCMEGSCDNLAIPVMNYTITETGKDYLKAGCHTIPKDDVRYIANLLNW